MPKDDQTVLFAYDGSDCAAGAIREAGRRLRPSPALVLTVWQSILSVPFGPIGMSEADVNSADSKMGDEAARTASEGGEIAREAGFDPKPITEVERPGVWRTIIAAAEEHDVALIVLGSHGRSGIPSLLQGSVATAVCQHAKRPVLIVPPAAGSAAGD